VLRDAILGLHFQPGEKLVERRLCEQTGVSRTCVREAMRQLEAEGLVLRTPTRGMFVKEVGLAEARQIYEVRVILEAAMAGQFVKRAGNKELAALEAALKKIERTIFGKDVLAYAVALDGFFDALLAGAENEIARQMLNTLRARITFLRTITARSASRERKEGTLKGLGALLEALRRKDAAAAEAQCRAFVQRSAEFAETVLEAHTGSSESSSAEIRSQRPAAVPQKSSATSRKR
jgi:DNA-binding GntR family transcriptional regulator